MFDYKKLDEYKQALDDGFKYNKDTGIFTDENDPVSLTELITYKLSKTPLYYIFTRIENFKQKEVTVKFDDWDKFKAKVISICEAKK